MHVSTEFMDQSIATFTFYAWGNEIGGEKNVLAILVGEQYIFPEICFGLQQSKSAEF